MADEEDATDDLKFPLRYTIGSGLVIFALVIGGLLLWWPQRDGPSSAQSDLGLSLLGGGLALGAGYGVSRVIFGAERRFDERLRHSEDERQREAFKTSLALASTLAGVDLMKRDLSFLRLYRKDCRRTHMFASYLWAAQFIEVDLTNADLASSDMGSFYSENCTFVNTRLSGVDANGARFLNESGMVEVDLQSSDLRGSWFRGPLIRCDFRGADMRGADLWELMLDPLPRNKHGDLTFEGALYSERTRWPDDFDPTAAGAKLVSEDYVNSVRKDVPPIDCH